MAATAALVVMTVLATVVSGLRRTGPQPAPVSRGAAPAAQDGAEPLAAAAERGLAEVANPNLPPREAIIACYAAMEQGLAVAPDAARRPPTRPRRSWPAPSATGR